jgi:hypothetical protein
MSSIDDCTPEEWRIANSQWCINWDKGTATKQIGGIHYKKCKIEPWDYAVANELDFFQGSIVKYVTRWRDKSGVEDLKKALHFLEKYIDVNSKRTD